MKANEWFYGSEGFGSSTVSQIPVVDPKALCQHRRRLTSYCPDCVDLHVSWPNSTRCDVTAVSENGIKWHGTSHTLTYERQEWLKAERDAKAAGLKIKVR